MDGVGGTSAGDTRGATTMGFIWMERELCFINARLHAFANEYWYVITAGKLTKFARYFFARQTTINRIHIVTMTLMVCFIPVKMNILWNKWNLKLLTSLHLCPTWYWISTINRASHKASIFLVAHGCRQCGDFATNLRCAYFHREPDFQMSMLDLDRAMSPVHNDLRDSQLSSWHESATSRTRAIGRQYRKYLDTFYYHIWDLISSLARAMQYCRPTSRELQ